jgi:hypothetical protein
VTVCDCPAARLKAPPPLTTENGAARSPTLPVNAAVEVAWLVTVRVWIEVCPTETFPKLTAAGVMEIFVTGATAVTFTVPTIPKKQWGEQK